VKTLGKGTTSARLPAWRRPVEESLDTQVWIITAVAFKRVRRKETLSGAYFELRTRIDQIVAQAEQQGSLAVALSGLNSLPHPDHRHSRR
jgi:hypothetical protein